MRWLTAFGFMVLTAARPSAADHKLRTSGWDVHDLVLDETAAVFRQGSCGRYTAVTTRPAGVLADFAGLPPTPAPASGEYTSREIAARFPFNDVVPSWNVEVPEGAGFVVELRFGRVGGGWTDFYYLGQWGRCGEIPQKIISNDDGEIDVDYFRSAGRFDRLQYRLRLFGPAGGRGPRLRRFALAYSNTLGDKTLCERFRRDAKPPAAAKWQRRLPVPCRSQAVEDESIRHNICSPTSVSMVMEYRGVRRTTRHMADVIWDPEYLLYGNWARAVQGAFVEGVPGYVRRFGDFEEVKELIARDQPVIASIRVPRGTALSGAPYRSSSGHLVVVAGFDEKGNVLVNDPAAKPPGSGLLAYRADEFRAVWLDNGGVGYVLLPPEGR